MTTEVEKSIEVAVPVSTAYNQWTQFEEFPQFMGGVQEVRQLDDRRLHWVAEIAGVRREWEAEIIEQVPDQKVAWAATEGATNAGAVFFTPVGPDRTMVRLHLEYEPEGVVEQVGDKLNIVGRQAQSDLEKFKSFIESRGAESGGWRGSVEGNVGTPVVEAAEETRGDSGKAGVSPKAMVTGAAAAAVGVAAAAALKGKGDSEETEETTRVTEVESVPVTGTTVTDTGYTDTDTGYADTGFSDVGTTGTETAYDTGATDPDRRDV
jgi:carbon monoxide dehydrogenase subunit G